MTTERAYDPRGGCGLVAVVLVATGIAAWLFQFALWLWSAGAPR